MSAVRVNGFTSDQWHYLTDTLRLIPASRADGRSLGARELLDPERCRTLLAQVAPSIGAPERRTAASLLTKRLGFLLTGAPLYALSVCDRGLDLSLDNCVIEFAHDAGRWTSSLPLRSLEGETWPRGDRDMARRELVQRLFAGLIAPIWHVLETEGGVSSRILWENLAVRVYSLYERRLARLEGEAVRTRCAEDFAFLRDAEPDLYGLDFNPIARFFHARSGTSEGGTERFRRTCCLYFKATCPAEYCQTCPLLKPREARGAPAARRRHASTPARIEAATVQATPGWERS
ncbi:siderophore-iron reductase, Fe-S cluster protein [Salinicola corii]|uniref:Siderophore-iron reductase, Fe-S cluster protein n=1 Tax=Salinicola corii TaxID=2606937 RepID=A0A640WDI2_9GAMM|nr:IucA/IucC family C-terminal-domain containing protein [Salinicola corii]KAA0016971.1 siderophore-iron reductase, Fe-S cluster protein [Salinicola corii]